MEHDMIDVLLDQFKGFDIAPKDTFNDMKAALLDAQERGLIAERDSDSWILTASGRTLLGRNPDGLRKHGIYKPSSGVFCYPCHGRKIYQHEIPQKDWDLLAKFSPQPFDTDKAYCEECYVPVWVRKDVATYQLISHMVCGQIENTGGGCVLLQAETKEGCITVGEGYTGHLSVVQWPFKYGSEEWVDSLDCTKELIDTSDIQTIIHTFKKAVRE